MIRFIAPALFALLLFTANAFADGIEKRVVDQFIIPQYLAFEDAAAAQTHKLETLCASPSTAHLEAARNAFAALALQWSRAEIIRFGPVLQENRLERILFWPDRKSIGLKQVQRAIGQKDQTALTIGSLQKKSVALQGLGALEFVLFGTGADEAFLHQDDYRCQFGLTISSALLEVAAEIVTEWDRAGGFGDILENPGENNQNYRESAETKRDILGTIAHGPSIFHDTRLKNYLGDDAGSAKPKSGLFWRSGLTLKSIAANVEGLRDFTQAADFNTLLDEEQHWIIDSYLFEAKNAVRATKLESPVLEAPISNERSKLEYLSLVLHSMAGIATDDLAQALGLTAGFSSLDGD